MKQVYLTGNVRAEYQTDKAFRCTLDWSEDHGFVARGLWVPLSVIHPEDHYKIEEAVEGELVEISIAKWWLDQQL